MTKNKTNCNLQLRLILANELLTCCYKVLVIDPIHSISIRFRQSNSPMTRIVKEARKNTQENISHNLEMLCQVQLQSLASLIAFTISVPMKLIVQFYFYLLGSPSYEQEVKSWLCVGWWCHDVSYVNLEVRIHDKLSCEARVSDLWTD